MLYKYGVRLNKHIVEDLQCSKIPIQTMRMETDEDFNCTVGCIIHY